MIVFMQFVSSNFNKERINPNFKNGKYNHLFDELKFYDENNIDNELKEIINNIIEEYGPRGYGYWIWKPYLILKEFEIMNDNDIIVHLNSHCFLENIENDFNNIKYILNNLNKPIITGFCHEMYTDYNLTTPMLINYFEKCLHVKYSKNTLLEPQVEAGILFIRKNKFTVDFVRQWFDLMINGIEFITDKYNEESKKINKDFIDHRHDQSALSLLCKYHHIKLFKSFSWEKFNIYNGITYCE